jgi:hypothetical protein
MATLTTVGALNYLIQLKDSIDIFLAFGQGLDTWGNARDTGPFYPDDGEVVNLPYSNVSMLEVTINDVPAVEGTEYDPNDFFVNYEAGIVYFNPDVITVGDIYRITYREGTVAESAASTALVSERFRKKVLNKYFVTPDPAGEIEIDSETYSVSLTPTGFLLCELTLLPGEGMALADYVREVGLFVGTKLAEGLTGLSPVIPSEVVTPGVMVMVSHHPAIKLSNVSRSKFQYLLTQP